MNILALDTCTELCSVSLSFIAPESQTNQQIDLCVEAPREHSQRLLPMVDEALQQANITLADVDLIAYGRGPGSFTGIRICTSMTQGLALGQDKDVIGISTLAAMAQLAIDEHNAEQMFCSIDARMNEVYWAQFTNQNGIATLVGEELVSAPNDVKLTLNHQQTTFACGTGFAAYPALLSLNDNIVLSETVHYPKASAMIPLAKHGHANGLHTSVDELAPVYLRDTVTWKKLPGRE
ncbi:tRNA (adenosine(37)-N6)-threonylcarbamoyltransferase complex dimerization subunit type 1 TsaB [Shewanella maritima]|uniref:tRNA (adenosine(37)-N6)-threonylcarbamoyltransferase complex dimerization subunit type 1 TsaB n=1 Tax=Shewanella maritima TaxID=2520507 RepID=UPI0037362CCE